MTAQVKMKVKEILARNQEFIPKRSRLQSIKDLIYFFNTLEQGSDWTKMKAVYPLME